MTELITELLQIPTAMRDLVDLYERGSGKARLNLPALERPLLVGMGASYHAAWIGSLMLRHAGILSVHEEASEVIQYQRALPARASPLIYISQSGSSGEVQPFIDLYGKQGQVIGITNDLASPLGAQADHVLPMAAGAETLIAGKTYANTLALLWLMAQKWAGADLAGALDQLRRLADKIEAIQARRAQVVERLEPVFKSASRVVFLGSGPHAASARQAAMTLSEWPKIACLSFGIGAYRHGFIESAGRDTAVVLFSASGPGRKSTLALGEELRGYGATVLRIENGEVLGMDAPAVTDPVDSFLSPVLDMVPVQLFAEVAARKRLETPGFRYISKVVTKI